MSGADFDNAARSNSRPPVSERSGPEDWRGGLEQERCKAG